MGRCRAVFAERVVLLLLLFALPVACGGNGTEDAAGNVASPELITLDGHAYRRADAWSAADLVRLRQEGRADLPSTTPEVLAAQLRDNTVYQGAYYIEVEPNVELARRILAGDVPQSTPATGDREARGIFGSDDRIRVTAATGWPAVTIAFNESRGSGNRIGRNTIYTAAHVIWDNLDPTTGWYCKDATVYSNYANPNGGCQLARWRFGVDGTSGATPWTPYGCATPHVQMAFTTLNGGSNHYDFARWDYAVIDISACGLALPSNLLMGTYLGMSDATLAATSVQQYGYAERVPCPNLSAGTATDCPGGTFQLTGSHEPYTGAVEWRATNGRVTAGAQQSAFTIDTTNIDLTHGDSGGAVFFAQSGPTDYRALGVASQAFSTVNIFQRWTSETSGYFSSHSQFPTDHP